MGFIQQIARVTHTDAQTVREAMKQGCEWGMAVKTGQRYTYIPYPVKLKELFGIDEDGNSVADSGNNKRERAIVPD